MAFCRCRPPFLSQHNLSHCDSDWKANLPCFWHSNLSKKKKKWEMWPKSAQLQYAYKVQVSDCKWFCSGQMNDVHCISHSVTVMCFSEIGLSASDINDVSPSFKFAFHRAADHSKRVPKRMGFAVKNDCKKDFIYLGSERGSAPKEKKKTCFIVVVRKQVLSI